MKFLIAYVFLSLSFSASAMLPRQAVKSTKGSTRRITKKSPTVSSKRYAVSKASGVKGATVAEYGAPVAAAQKQAVASSYWSRAYTNLALASGNLWKSFKNMFSRSQLNSMKIVEPINVKELAAPDIYALVASNQEIVKNAKADEILLPTMTEEEAIAVVAQDALNDIEKAHQERNLPLVEKDLIVCTPPGINSALLLEFDSIEAIKDYFRKRYSQLDLEYKEIVGMNDVEYEQWLTEKKEISDTIKGIYKKSNPQIIHSETLPRFVLETTKQLLTLIGINSLSVNIMSTADYEKIFPDISLPKTPAFITTPISRINNRIFVHRPGVCFDAQWASSIVYEPLLASLIAHEVGHLMHHHVQGYILYPKRGDRVDDNALVKLQHKVDLLHEIEADIAVALTNKDVARVMHEYMLDLLKSEEAPSLTGKDRGNVYQNSYEWYQWIQRINELHKKEKKRQEL